MKDLIIANKYKLDGDHLSVTVTEKSERTDEETKEVKVSWINPKHYGSTEKALASIPDREIRSGDASNMFELLGQLSWINGEIAKALKGEPANV
ncbi:hypothetical protein [Terribacillus sp. JSM ZJ617]|uniref:hypothetical protein n=1 Tax=Terribacillus sp. JSM ZJ617 TaxID=3342119 RepID=UPI0035A8DE3B